MCSLYKMTYFVNFLCIRAQVFANCVCDRESSFVCVCSERTISVYPKQTHPPAPTTATTIMLSNGLSLTTLPCSLSSHQHFARAQSSCIIMVMVWKLVGAAERCVPCILIAFPSLAQTANPCLCGSRLDCLTLRVGRGDFRACRNNRDKMQ